MWLYRCKWFTGSGVTASANGIERGFNNYKGFDISEMRDYQNIKIFRFEVTSDTKAPISIVEIGADAKK